MSRFSREKSDFEVAVDEISAPKKVVVNNPQHQQHTTANVFGSINFDDHNEPYVPTSSSSSAAAAQQRRPSATASRAYYNDEQDDDDDNDDESSPVLLNSGGNGNIFSSSNGDDDEMAHLASRRRRAGYLSELQEMTSGRGGDGGICTACISAIRDSWKRACVFFAVVGITIFMFLTIASSAGSGQRTGNNDSNNTSNTASQTQGDSEAILPSDFDYERCDPEAAKVLQHFVYRVFSRAKLNPHSPSAGPALLHDLTSKFSFCVYKHFDNDLSRKLKKAAGWHPSKDAHDHSGYHERVKGTKDAFSVESKTTNQNNNNNIIIIEATSRVAASHGFYWYLKNVLSTQSTWGADLPSAFFDSILVSTTDADHEVEGTHHNGRVKILLPSLKKVSILSSVPWRHAWNMVTFGYTSTWWDWERWEKEIDWMALHGVNLPLAFVGQEYVWIQAFAQYGIQPEEMEEWFAGPAFLPWQRGGNLMGFGGPLPMQWIIDQRDLQRKILKRMRSLGMTPVLPCFAGHVPAAAKRAWPHGHYSKVGVWNNFPSKFADVLVIDPHDKAFGDISAAFMKAQDQVYNNSGYYSCDTFNENDPSDDSEEYLAGASKAVVDGITKTDASGVWIMQAWLFSPKHFPWWQNAIRVERYLKGADRDHFIILDLHAEDESLSLRNNNFYGKASIWCLLHNFGGVRGMYGDLNRIANGPFDDMNRDKETVQQLHNNNLYKHYFTNITTTVLGMGFVPESIEQNPIVYELMTDNFFRSQNSDNNNKFDVESWTKRYIAQRYSDSRSSSKSLSSSSSLVDLYSFSSKDSLLWKSWSRLLSGFYSSESTPRTELEMVPMLRGDLGTWKAGAPEDMFAAFDLLLNSVTSGEVNPEESDGLHYDAVDIARQAATMFFTDAHVMWLNVGNDLSTSTKHGNFDRMNKFLLELISRIDDVFATDKNYLLGVWLEGAKKAASTVKNQQERKKIEKLFRYNAKNQITMWGPRSQITDYAAKSWSGLYKYYYLQRYNITAQYVKKVGGVRNANPTDRDNAVLEFEIRWNEQQEQEENENYPTTPSGVTWKDAATSLMDHIAVSNQKLNSAFVRHERGIQSYPSYRDYEGFSSMPLWTKEPRELARLCLTVDDCTGFSSNGYLFSSQSLKPDDSKASMNVDLYVLKK